MKISLWKWGEGVLEFSEMGALPKMEGGGIVFEIRGGGGLNPATYYGGIPSLLALFSVK